MSVFFLLVGKNLGQTLNRSFGIHRTGRIIRGIDDNTLGLLVNPLFKLFEVNLEALGIRRNNHTLCACTFLDEACILREKDPTNKKEIFSFKLLGPKNK